MDTLAAATYFETQNQLSQFEKDEMDLGSHFPPSIGRPTDAQRAIVRHVLLVYNPQSGSHDGERIMNETKDIMEKATVKVDVVALERKNHAETLLSTMNLDGVDVIGAIGGDGTFHECVNGMMRRKDNKIKEVALAMIPGGTGNSFSLELSGGTDFHDSILHLLRGIHCPIDIAELSFPKADVPAEDWEIMYSFNSIHWGLASKVSALAERMRWMGKAIRYTAAALVEVFGGHKIEASIEMEDGDGNHIHYHEEFCLIIANNIISAAKGMKMAPNAKLNDGLIDLIIVRSNKTIDLLDIFAHVYEGKHTELDEVEYRQVRSFSVKTFTHQDHHVIDEANPSKAKEVVDVDGELKGSTPFVCTMLPRALRVII